MSGQSLAPLAPGQQLDRFVIRGTLGKGENAQVYRAFHDNYRREVAIKVFHPDITRTESLTPLFKHQASDIIHLKHPNITRVLEAGIVDDSYYLVLELIEGTTLRDELSTHPDGFDRTEGLRLFRQIASGVAYAHEQGITHGNIKPDNVLLTHANRPILTDFNIPCFREHPSGRGGAASPVYLAPEQITTRTLVTDQSDIYSLGILLYELMTGDVPFKSSNFNKVAQQQLEAPPPSPAARRVGLDPRIEDTIMIALNKDPDARFDSVRDMLASLEGNVDSYETVTFTRSDLEQAKKKRAAEIRQFEQARAVPGDTTRDTASLRIKPRWLLFGVLGLVIIAVVVALLVL